MTCLEHRNVSYPDYHPGSVAHESMWSHLMQDFALAHPYITFFMFCALVNGVVLIIRGRGDAA